ncbi:MAG: winged helix-turn-helix transcriptional regulator [Ruminococcaceae bacterium]|nr:winged helix-turn-helix transcriptional regulator [Oscillospiraceae bacterium]
MSENKKEGRECQICGDSKGQQVVCHFICASRMHRKAISKYASYLGLHHSQHRMLMHLANNEVIRSQKQLAEHFGISPAAVATTLKKLEADGYIERAKSADGLDCRNNEIIITELGRRVATESEKYFKFVDCQVIKDFSDEEIETFIGFLDRIQQNLTDIDDAKVIGEQKE